MNLDCKSKLTTPTVTSIFGPQRIWRHGTGYAKQDIRQQSSRRERLHSENYLRVVTPWYLIAQFPFQPKSLWLQTKLPCVVLMASNAEWEGQSQISPYQIRLRAEWQERQETLQHCRLPDKCCCDLECGPFPWWWPGKSLSWPLRSMNYSGLMRTSMTREYPGDVTLNLFCWRHGSEQNAMVVNANLQWVGLPATMSRLAIIPGNVCSAQRCTSRPTLIG